MGEHNGFSASFNFNLFCYDDEHGLLREANEVDFSNDCYPSSSSGSDDKNCEYFSQIEKLPFIDEDELVSGSDFNKIPSSSARPFLHLKIPDPWDKQLTWNSECRSSPSTSRYVQFDQFRPGRLPRFHSPYSIWKEKFMKERGCDEDRLFSEIFWTSLPHLIINFSASMYIILGALLFQILDDEIGKQPFFQAVLFTFTTITTIGYGNVVPTTHLSRIFCIAYTIFGVPLVFMALSQGGQFLAEGYWILVTSLSKHRHLVSDDESRLPLRIVLILLILHSFVGGMFYHFWIDEMPFISAVYFSFISITTIGFGEFIPSPVNNFEALVTIFYLVFGIVIMSTLVGSLSNHLRKLHYIGRKRVDDAKNVEVWFGGARLSIKELVHVVGNQFDVSPMQLHELLHELDQILSLAFNPTGADTPTSSSTNVEANIENNQLTVLSKRSEKSVKALTPSIFSSKFEDQEQHEKLIRALGTFHHISMSKNRNRSFSGLSNSKTCVKMPTDLLSANFGESRRNSLPPLNYYRNAL